LEEKRKIRTKVLIRYDLILTRLVDRFKIEVKWKNYCWYSLWSRRFYFQWFYKHIEGYASVELNLTISSNYFNFFYFNFCVESDECYVRFSERSLTEKTKEAQKSSSKSSTKEKDEGNLSLEGQLHRAGITE